MSRIQQALIPAPPQTETCRDRFAEFSPDGYWELDQQGCITHCNRQFGELLGFTDVQLQGKTLVSFLTQDNDNAALHIQECIHKRINIVPLVCGFSHASGLLRYVELTAEPYFDTQGTFQGFQGLLRALPGNTSLENTLHNLADGISATTGTAFFRSLVTHMAELLQVDYALVGEFTNQDVAMVRVITVCARGEISEDFCYPIKGTPCEEVFSGRLSCFAQDVQAFYPEDPMLPEMQASSYLGAPLYTADGRINGIMAVIHSQPFTHVNYIESIFRLYVARAAAELERQQMVNNLERVAHHDDLTGLCNRSLFRNLLTQAIAASKRTEEKLALLYLDLDSFKNINDTLGHDAGDKVLTIVAQRLQDALRNGDVVARLGGDEFIIMLHHVKDANSISQTIRKILAIVSEPIIFYLHQLQVTTSVGISVFPDDGNNVSALMKHADIALYKAKDHGRNTFQFYSDEMGQAITQKLNLEMDLGQALSNDEFKIYFQPLIETATQNIVAAEALLQWQHPKKGMLKAGEFIPLLEETGGIVEVGRWLLETTLDQLDKLRQGLNNAFSVSVNISARQLRDQNFVSYLQQYIENNNTVYESLNIELTESVLIEEGPHITELLEFLKSRGVNICLDDFGTGYSSLNYLRKFPIDTIKIDRSFIRDIPHNSDDLTLVKALIELAKTLGLKVIAEGVENEEQLLALRELHCPVIQGFYYSKPIPLEQWPQFVKAHQNSFT